MSETVIIKGTRFDIPSWFTVEEFECVVGQEVLPENPLSSLVSCELYAKAPTDAKSSAEDNSFLDVYKVQFKVPYGEARELSDALFRPVVINELIDGEYETYTPDGESEERFDQLLTDTKVDYQLEDDGIIVSFYADGLQDLCYVTAFVAPTASFMDDLEAQKSTIYSVSDLTDNLENIEEDFAMDALKKETRDGVEYTVGLFIYSD